MDDELKTLIDAGWVVVLYRRANGKYMITCGKPKSPTVMPPLIRFSDTRLRQQLETGGASVKEVLQRMAEIMPDGKDERP